MRFPLTHYLDSLSDPLLLKAGGAICRESRHWLFPPLRLNPFVFDRYCTRGQSYGSFQNQGLLQPPIYIPALFQQFVNPA